MFEKVIIYDPNPLVVSGLNILLTKRRFQVVGASSNIDECLHDAYYFKPEIIIIDPTYLTNVYIDKLNELQKLNDKLKVVILAKSDHMIHVLRSYKVVYSIYLSKTLPVETIFSKLSQLSGSEQQLITEFPVNDQESHFLHRLTKREIQVLCKLATGKNNIIIARELNLSNKTISTYKRSIMVKLNMPNMREIIDFARRHGF